MYTKVLENAIDGVINFVFLSNTGKIFFVCCLCETETTILQSREVNGTIHMGSTNDSCCSAVWHYKNTFVI